MKRVLITGASSGIGKTIYEYYRKLPDYKAIGLSRKGPDVHFDLRQTRKYIDDLSFLFPIHMLINCAGIMPLNESREEEYIIQINFVAVYDLIQKFMKQDLCIINIASISALFPDCDLPVYAASKAALLSLTSSIAKKYANVGVRCNAISPGFFDTNLVEGKLPDNLMGTIPMKREGDPKEILPVVKMLETNEYITGTNIIIDGGASCKTL